MLKVLNFNLLEKRRNYLLNKLPDISFIIKTLERKQQLINQLQSLQNLKCKCPILIADDSKKPYEKEILNLFPHLNITYFSLPYDTGTSEGRNIMLDSVKTPYFVLCDDDFIFDPRSHIPLMREMLIKNDFDILGGVFIEYWAQNSFEFWLYKLAKKLFKYGIIIPSLHKHEYTGSFHFEGEICRIEKVDFKEPFVECDLTHNFFLAKTSRIRAMGGWNPILKGGEHHCFFIKAYQSKLKVASTNNCGVIHDRNMTPCSEEYTLLRSRDHGFQPIGIKEFGLKELIHYNGAVFKSH
jgi:glycosyltransferase involved in cell wall biosynthesis